MDSYSEWNAAMIAYFIHGTPSGATIYLSVDDSALMDIGSRFEQPNADHTDWVDDFIEAVRSECVIGKQVCLDRISGHQQDGMPRCVAFLGAMVLAAHRMAGEETEDQNIASINYFTRLRQILSLTEATGGRPSGLDPAGVEEKLWKMWNQWLISNGWLSSAERGQSVRDEYINYPLSQALLREGDKDVLERFFREEEKSGRLSRVWDRDTLSSWLRGHRQQLSSKHLRQLLQEADLRRYEAITEAIYGVYDSIDWNQEMPRFASRRTTQRRLTAGIYRDENPILGTVDYWLSPRQPRQHSSASLEVIQDGCPHPLREDRPGWFLPLWIANPAGGVSYDVKGHPQIKELIVPERGFWILIRDPENESSGVFASWGYPGLGEKFLLLCRKEYTDQMEIFRQEALIQWDHQVSIDDEWYEYRECRIVSPSWEGIIPQRQDLYDALKPTVSATISLKDGLRVPHQGGWLEGYAPEMTIIAFDDSPAALKVLDVSRPDKPIMDEVVNTNQQIRFPSLNPGSYLVEVNIAGTLVARRTLRILSWNSLPCGQPKQPFSSELRTFLLQGAIIKAAGAESSEET